MYTKQRAKIIEPHNSKKTPFELEKAMMALKSIEAEDSPWVEIDGVYCSISITGNTTWIPLVNSLYDLGYRKFAIFGGRHGSVLNPVEANGRLIPAMWDAEHFDGDAKAAVDTMKYLNSCEVTCIDLKHHTFTHPSQQLKNLTHTYYAEGYQVIYAWCYSLFAFEEANPYNLDYLKQNQKANTVLHNSMKMCSIDTITKMSWTWWNPN